VSSTWRRDRDAAARPSHGPRARRRRILVTCAPSNVSSRKTIEANGGVLEGIVFADEVQRETCHYWIETEDRG
jgi:hypothetical protein